MSRWTVVRTRSLAGLASAVLAAAVLASSALVAAPAAAQSRQSLVASTVHNLSVSGPGEVRSLTEKEICKFCHIPHSAQASEPLWSHSLSNEQYVLPRERGSSRRTLSQPDGSSRLCLSCHDGTVALGDVTSEPGPIAMTVPRLTSGRRGYLGRDLSGSHPVSFAVRDSQRVGAEDGRDMGVRPVSLIEIDRDVRLDAMGKMQCTSCHDPHDDSYYVPGKVPHFWVKPTVSGVCLTCHELR